MKVDLLITNGRIVTATGFFRAGLAVDAGKIVLIAKTPHLPAADKVLDAEGHFVMPGVIDGHVHFWDPGYTYREDWRSGTMSAAGGGVTTVIEMPTTTPPTLTPEAFQEKRGLAEGKAVVDFALHAGVTPRTIDYIPALRREGAASFKMFMAEKVREFDEMDAGSLHEAFMRVRGANAVASVHAESKLAPYLRRKLQEAGRKDPAAHPESRPRLVEIDAISRALLLAEETKVRLHICHMTTASGGTLVGEAKRKDIDVSAETCPHYLLFNRQNYRRLGPYLKVNPPIRSREDQLALWKGLQNRTIDIVATDHCPFPRKEKEGGWENIWEAGTGVPGTETLLSLMVSEGVKKGRIGMPRLSELLCETPARIFGLYPQKGTIAVGADADVVVVDLKERRKITIEKMHTKGEFTPFEGWEVTGCPTITLVRGSIVAEDGEVVGKEGYGAFVPRTA